MMLNLRKKVNRQSLYSDYVNILNGVLQLSKREAEVFSFILAADATDHKDDINSQKVRSLIVATLGISEPNLSRYLGTLKSKKLILRGPDGKWILNDNIRPNVIGDVIEITYTLELKNNIDEEIKLVKS